MSNIFKKKKLRVGIYNKYLYAYGGGERHSCYLAAFLCKKCHVDLITHVPIDKKALKRRLNIDLKNINIRYLPRFFPRTNLSKITSEYDFFIIFTAFYPVKSFAKKNMALIFFPIKTGRRIRHNLSIATKWIILKLKKIISIKWNVLGLPVNRQFKKSIFTKPEIPPPYSFFTKSDPILAVKQFFKNTFSFASLLCPTTYLLTGNNLKNYQMICTNSGYSKKWLKNYWDIESDVLFPPVDTDYFVPLKKENIILSVGRFFEGRHNKKHIYMIKAFKKLYDKGVTDWTYHIIGGTTANEVHQDYLKHILDECVEYPIYIHTDIPVEQLQIFYGKAKIFWHAAGYGEDGNRNPENFEHFGMVTAEAMSAGCIPIVYEGGGQTEIVSDNENGFFFKDLDTLIKKTKEVIENELLSDRLKQNAMVTSRRFDKEHFEKSFLNIIKTNKDAYDIFKHL